MKALTTPSRPYILVFFSFFLSILLWNYSLPRETIPYEWVSLKPNPPQSIPILPEKALVLVVIDGPRYSETTGDPQHRYIPKLWQELRPQGTLLRGFRNQGETYTIPGHLAALSGRYLWVSNEGFQRIPFPTIFEYFRKHYQAPLESCVVFASKPKLRVATHSVSKAYGFRYRASDLCGRFSLESSSREWLEDQEMFTSALTWMKAKQPRLVLISFRSPDSWGHGKDWEKYLKGIQQCDQWLWELWNFLQSDPFYQKKTTLLMTNDHGRHLEGVADGFISHGCACKGCRQINFFAIGPEIRENYEGETAGHLIDISSTAGYLMGFPTPESQGKVLEEIFRQGAFKRQTD
jgi:hypothetical protein